MILFEIAILICVYCVVNDKTGFECSFKLFDIQNNYINYLYNILDVIPDRDTFMIKIDIQGFECKVS